MSKGFAPLNPDVPAKYLHLVLIYGSIVILMVICKLIHLCLTGCAEFRENVEEKTEDKKDKEGKGKSRKFGKEKPKID